MATLPSAACALVMRLNGPSGDLEVLTVSRKHDATDVGLPGGKREAGEDLLATAFRELKEETGMINVVAVRVPVLVADGDTGADVVTTCECHTFIMAALGGPNNGTASPNGPTSPHETGVVAWLPWREALSRSKSFGAYNARLAADIEASLDTVERLVAKLGSGEA